MNHYPFRKFITSLGDLFEIVERIREYRGMLNCTEGRLITEMYRGHGRSCWKLLPNLARNINDPVKLKEIEKGIVTEFHEELTRVGLTKHIQKGFLNGQFHSDWLLIQQAQHYRVPTRFMDWTNDWKVALFFAVENPEYDNFDGHFWIYVVQPEMLVGDTHESSYFHDDPFEFKESIFLNSSSLLSEEYLSKIAVRRKFRQYGKFCIQSYEACINDLDSDEIHKPNLYPVIIPHYLKKKIRQELEEENITNASLYVEEEPEINKIVLRLREKYGV